MCDCEQKKPCTCKRANNVVYTKGCGEIQDASCVIYKPLGGESSIFNTLKLGVKSKLSDVIERIDQFLTSAFNVNLTNEQSQSLNLSNNAEIQNVLSKLINLTIAKKDENIKVSESDSNASNLYDKVECGECLEKQVISKLNGGQVLKISIDYECLKTNLS